MKSATPPNSHHDWLVRSILPLAHANILAQAGIRTIGQLEGIGYDGLQKIDQLSVLEMSQIDQACKLHKVWLQPRDGGHQESDDSREPMTQPTQPAPAKREHHFGAGQAGDQTTRQATKRRVAMVSRTASSTEPATEQPVANVKGGIMKLERVPLLNKKISCIVRINQTNRRRLNQEGFTIVRHLVERTKAEIQKKTGFSDEAMHAIGFQLAQHELSFKGEDWHTYLEGQRHPAKPSVPGATSFADFIPSWAIRKRLEGDGISTMEELAERFPTLAILRTKTREMIRQAIERFRANGTAQDPRCWQPLATSVIIRPENDGATVPAPDDKNPPAITLVGTLTPTRQDGMTIGNLGEIKLDAQFHIGDQPFKLVLLIKPPGS